MGVVNFVDTERDVATVLFYFRGSLFPVMVNALQKVDIFMSVCELITCVCNSNNSYLSSK